MDKLLITAALFALGVWIWSEYFRAIPHLEESGVLKNFKVESVQPVSATYMVLDKSFIKPDRRVLHQASPFVGSFNDLAYVSNIDVLLTTQPLPDMQAELELDKPKRCFQIEGAINNAEQETIKTHVQHFSLIAANENIANLIRRLKSGQQVHLQGDIVSVHSGTTGQAFHAGTGSKHRAQCQMLKVTSIQIQ
ncbi:hypothetical protein BS636_07175 [Acinetobacter sp. LoGeW2-3]|uniref:hypothetical protein n=1 Tax=Acinetobacter sp. LoGeW2-3 TaxID=1808001 RepID=UPI000C059C3B|nr:hypothetical protein [Acinetobacter sp. LoGeW2-3]ATO19456.1 hypothetical protein BS636_07175 [Acinetobacter sp. LoGeW2-3]